MATKVRATWGYRSDDRGRRLVRLRCRLGSRPRGAHASRSPSISARRSRRRSGSWRTAMMDAEPSIDWVRMVLPNLHHWKVDLSPFGLDNPGEVFVSTTEPHGLIDATVRRRDVKPQRAAARPGSRSSAPRVPGPRRSSRRTPSSSSPTSIGRSSPSATALLERRVERQAGDRRRRYARPPARHRRDPRRSAVARRRGAAGPARPARRDHRPGRAEDDHQRAQLGRPGVHGGLRGLARRRPGRTSSAGRLRCATPSAGTLAFDSPGGQGVPPRRAPGDAPRAAARLAPPGAPPQGRRRADVRDRCSTSGCTRSTTRASGCAAAPGCTSTSRSSSRTARRGSGTTCSSRPRPRSGSRGAPSERRS